MADYDYIDGVRADKFKRKSSCLDLAYFKEQLLGIKEVKPVGRTRTVDGVICHAVGFVLRTDGELSLLSLEYDELGGLERERHDREIRAEMMRRMSMLQNGSEPPMTNRAAAGWFQSEPGYKTYPAQKIFSGETAYTCVSCEREFCDTSRIDLTALFARFILEGWEPPRFDTQNPNSVTVVSHTFEGTYASAADIDASAPLRFVLGPRRVNFKVELPLTLTVGEARGEKIELTDPATARRYRIKIDRVYLLDMRSELREKYDDPSVTACYTKEELTDIKARMEAELAEDCPEGMKFLAVDYECDEKISVRFFGREWLERASTVSDGSNGEDHAVRFYLARPDRPASVPGLTLMTALIHEPVPENLERLEAELFDCSATVPRADVVL